MLQNPVFATLFSQINWHAVFWGMGLQFWFAVLIRKTEFGSAAFEWLADRVVEFLKYTDKGSMVVFGSSYQDHRFVFQVGSFFPACRFRFCDVEFLFTSPERVGEGDRGRAMEWTLYAIVPPSMTIQSNPLQ